MCARILQVPSSSLSEYGTLSTELFTECHHDSIGYERSVRVWKVGGISRSGQPKVSNV